MKLKSRYCKSTFLSQSIITYLYFMTLYQFLDRFKGHLCPLSFNDEFLQDLLKRGIIPKDDQHQDTTTSATYKSMCSRAVILLNYIEHVRLIISSKKGDLKVLFEWLDSSVGKVFAL